MEKLSFRDEHTAGPAPRPAAQTSAPRPASRKKKSASKKAAVWMLVILIIAALAGGGVYLYGRYQNVKKENDRLTSNPQEAVKKEQENIIKAVGALTDLPAGETPTVATVSDASKLKSQTFFANAENGDKVLIYTNAKKAYLYRPSTNKVINIAPVNIGESEAIQESTDETN